MRVQTLVESLKELEIVNDILQKMKYIMEESKKIEEEWNDPQKWWNR